jgi:tRNA-splicing ligase RtcB
MRIIKDDSMRIPVKLWLDDIEEGALKQAVNLARLDFAYRHIAVMPDAHSGYGMPIGGVLAARDHIIPNAVGVDIGCGMCAARTALTSATREELKAVMGAMRRAIPVGFDHHREMQSWSGFDRAPDVRIIQQELKSARYQLGTLGGGNHFLEIQSGSDGFLWIMVHSGSRNFGLKIAREYHERAAALCRRKNIRLPDRDLAFLAMESREAREYMDAMSFALDFARENRLRMIEAIKTIFRDNFPGVEFGGTINIHHNYAAVERHFGVECIVHRKGATSAFGGQTGIIPGSQGSRSYIVRGKGNPESFMSCSHGAGRRMGRKQAQRELDLQDEKRKLEEQGILHALRGAGDLDEASEAYKDIETVMKNQRDLVEILVELKPLAVVKG